MVPVSLMDAGIGLLELLVSQLFSLRLRILAL